MILDAAIVLLLRVLLAILLLGASMHKFADRNKFSGIVAAYQLAPAALLPLLAILIPLAEMILGLAWLTGIQLGGAAIATALLLGMYTAAIGINLFRGNVDIDCGCGFGKGNREASGYQRLSAGLLARNGLLIGITLVALLPTNDRLLGILDYGMIAMASCGLLLLYAAFNQLLANKHVIDSWRVPVTRQGDSHA